MTSKAAADGMVGAVVADVATRERQLVQGGGARRRTLALRVLDASPSADHRNPRTLITATLEHGKVAVTVLAAGGPSVPLDVEAERQLASTTGVINNAVVIADALRLIDRCLATLPRGWDTFGTWSKAVADVDWYHQGHGVANLPRLAQHPAAAVWAVHPNYVCRAAICKEGLLQPLRDVLIDDPNPVVAALARRIGAAA